MSIPKGSPAAGEIICKYQAVCGFGARKMASEQQKWNGLAIKKDLK